MATLEKENWSNPVFPEPLAALIGNRIGKVRSIAKKKSPAATAKYLRKKYPSRPACLMTKLSDFFNNGISHCQIPLGKGSGFFSSLMISKEDLGW
ncbi:hypothetical protein WICPIJ_005705 [Wickerhamomyces pijperi]|uniref:Uncharacterized protein n=1 Tax=Wickerhamomyces pijperi TaxID=599730 RepID=A0A9P8Q5S8_WICPI|nr:hypothetical protein WICPIJ_005705 [Wickerhamomyces pijperi]